MATDNIIYSTHFPSNAERSPAPIIRCFGDFLVQPLDSTKLNVQFPDGSVNFLPFQDVERDQHTDLRGLDTYTKFNFVTINVNSVQGANNCHVPNISNNIP